MSARNSAIRLDTPDQLVDQTIAWTKEASQHAVDYVLTRIVGEDDGRSPWFWMRLANGDLALATSPRGETYEYVSDGGDAVMAFQETCPKCGQPDNCGDCDHTPVEDGLAQDEKFLRKFGPDTGN